MKTILSLATLLLAFGVFAQNQPVNSSDLNQKLENLKSEITLLEDKISHIETRIAGIPENEVGFEVYERIEGIKQKRNALKGQAYSIEMHLNGTTDIVMDVKVITSEEFSKYPTINQNQILARPDRYLVLDN